MSKRIFAPIGVAVFIGTMLMMTGCPPKECDGEIWVNAQDLPKLAAPTQLLPEEGEVFETYPRDTTLTWEAIDDAATYDVEIDCYHCCGWDQWCTDLEEPPQTTAIGLTDATYDFSWVGAQPGRWRVRAVRSNGQEGKWSDWREFEYTI